MRSRFLNLLYKSKYEQRSCRSKVCLESIDSGDSTVLSCDNKHLCTRLSDK